MHERGVKDRITNHGHTYNAQRLSFIALGFAADGLGFVISGLGLGFEPENLGFEIKILGFYMLDLGFQT